MFWNRRYEPAIRDRDAACEKQLRDHGIEVHTFNASLLHEPWTILNQSGRPFQVFSSFWRRCLRQLELATPLAAPIHLPLPPQIPRSVSSVPFRSNRTTRRPDLGSMSRMTRRISPSVAPPPIVPCIWPPRPAIIVYPTLPGVDPVWLGIMMAVNLQTSYMHPPLGPTLFFLRGVAPPEITTRHIYVGIIPFVAIQLLALVVLWFVPGLATTLPRALYGH